MTSAFLPSRGEVEERIRRIVEDSYREKLERLNTEYERARSEVEDRFRGVAESFKQVLEKA